MARGIPKRRMRWNLPAFEDIRRLPKVEAEIARKVEAVKSAAASGKSTYAGGTEDGGDRVRGYVVTTNLAAMHAERNHALQRALAAQMEASKSE